jgi:hypothetical protein
MNEEFVTYELALALKELEFDEPCLGVFDNQTKELFLNDTNGLSIKEIPTIFTLAPTWQQVFRFFREKHNLHCFIQCPEEPIGKEIHTYTKWCFSIFEINKQELFFSDEKYETYEEVELECLKKLIELCKKN